MHVIQKSQTRARSRRNAPVADRNKQARTISLAAKLAISAVLLFHIQAQLLGAFLSHSHSKQVNDYLHVMKYYFGFLNQGLSYRYYARLDTTTDPAKPNPWGTPIVWAELEFEASEDNRTLRIPERPKLAPRVRFQRQLDLAYHVYADPRWAASYARHICRATGCKRVKLFAQTHFIPDLPAWHSSVQNGRPITLDLESPETYGPLIELGDFKCTDF